jgi:cytochrome c peroxidase
MPETRSGLGEVASAARFSHQAYLPESPVGIEVEVSNIPADNPMTRAKVELGKLLYFDPRLSRDGTISCATCHHPRTGWTDAAPVSTGIRGQLGGRSAPTVMNRVLGTEQFWDGRAASLEEQAVGPIGNPIEMGFTVEEAAVRLAKIPGYAERFQAVFQGPPNKERIGKAIATFERTVLVGGAPNDYFEAAESFIGSKPHEDDTAEDLRERSEALEGWKKNPMSASAMQGRGIYFGKGKCSLCHVGPNLTDEQYHNIGVGMDRQDFDKGREVHTGLEKDRGAFRTPTLRNISDTAPYMHDGSQPNLEVVVDFYNQGGHKNPWLSPRMQPLGLSSQEKKDLVAFLREGLQGTVTHVEVPALPSEAGE